MNSIDSACHALPPTARLVVYGLVMGALAMLIYWLTSPQRRIAALKSEISNAQRALRTYSGTDGREILRLTGRAIGPVLRQMALVLGPTLLAAAPIVLVMFGLAALYSDRFSGNWMGPSWLRSWEVPFMLGATIAALALKFSLKIA
jgi:hypothetical protein